MLRKESVISHHSKRDVIQFHDEMIEKKNSKKRNKVYHRVLDTFDFPRYKVIKTNILSTLSKVQT